MKLSKSVLMAGVIAVSVVLWMLTGLVGSRGSASQSPDAGPEDGMTEGSPIRVAVVLSHATRTTREIILSARTEPNRGVELRAETDGKVVELIAMRGALISEGEKIVILDMRDRSARLREVQAMINQRKLELEGAKKLKDQEFISEIQIAEANARLVSAHADLETIELEIAHTTIEAPFDGVMQERMVELGDYVNSGDSIAQLVDIDPLIVVGEINEREIAKIRTGGEGYARMVDGSVANGTIRYISPVADENTRTFRIELAIPNGEGKLRAGMTAEMRLAGDTSDVHFFSPALLALDDEGVIGVKTVNDQDIVEFHRVEIIDSNEKGISVSGLPREIKLIIVGQGFVKAGQRVIPVINPSPIGMTSSSNSLRSGDEI